MCNRREVKQREKYINEKKKEKINENEQKQQQQKPDGTRNALISLRIVSYV